MYFYEYLYHGTVGFPDLDKQLLPKTRATLPNGFSIGFPYDCRIPQMKKKESELEISVKSSELKGFDF